jgi:hypothetical protein
MTKKLNLVIRQGETFTRVIRWETPPYVYKAITAITQAAPVQITAVGHGLKSGWRAAVVSVRGMKEINAEHSPPRDSEFHQVTVVDVDNVTLNDVNSSDFSAYTSGGYLQYYTPVNLTGYTARMTIKDRVGGTALLTLTSGLPDNRIVVDTANNTVTLSILPADTAALGFIKGVYDLEMVSGAGAVTTIFSGSITVAKEVTT